MRIAFVYDIPYPWHKGGIEHILDIESRELAKKHDVHFFTMRWPGMKSEFVHQNVSYHAFGSITEEGAYKHGRRAIREAIMFSMYVNELYKYDFDVVITNAFPVLHLPVIKSYCRLKNAKLILKVDEVWDRDYWRSYLGPIVGDSANFYANLMIRSSAALYVANSATTADRLRKLGIGKGRISVFAPVLDDSGMKSIRKSAGRRRNRIIFSGRLIKEKRVDKWLGIVGLVLGRNRNAEALLVGEGIERQRLLRKMDELGLKGKVTVKPFFKDKKDLYTAIARSKVLLHMGEREGLSIITLESLALGTPVVLPDYSPIPKEVRDMCIVEKEKDIPSRILRIMSRESTPVRNSGNLEMFSTSNVIPFYDRMFRS